MDENRRHNGEQDESYETIEKAETNQKPEVKPTSIYWY